MSVIYSIMNLVELFEQDLNKLVYTEVVVKQTSNLVAVFIMMWLSKLFAKLGFWPGFHGSMEMW